MSRAVSDSFLEALYAEETDATPVVLMTIEHDDLDEPLRFCNNPTERITTDPLLYGTVRLKDETGEETYYFVPFQITLPSEGEDVQPTMQIQLSNVGRETTDLLRSTDSPAKVRIDLVTSDDPDLIEVSFPNFDLTSADIEAGTVTLNLTLNSYATEPFPAGAYTPSGFPSLF